MKWGFGFFAVIVGFIVIVYGEGDLESVQNVKKQISHSNSSNGEVLAVHISKIVNQQSKNPFGFKIQTNYDGLLETTTNPSQSDEDEFPPFLTPEQQRNGGVVLCFIVAIYCFTLLAIVCDKYFIPSIERLCEVMDIPADVGAATFMSVATSCPELFTNIIATFVTGSELGIGTIVGSSMFNSLGVASIGSLAAIRPIKLDWWPVSRDVCIYMVAISVLIGIVWDARIYWYEALILFILYFVYFFVMFQNTRISRFVRRQVDRLKNRSVVDVISAESGKDKELREKQFSRDSVRASVASAFGTYSEDARKSAFEHPEEYKKQRELEEAQEIESIKKSPFIIPEGGWFTKCMFFYTWLIKMALRCTIPNPKTHPNLWPISFIMCIFWIGGNSYIVSWMVSIIGDVFNIPATVQGMTFMAAGGSLPESLSIAIMARRGEGKMGVSNSLGANTMNILFSLGMPWFFKTMTMGVNNNSFISIESGSIVYTIMSLILVGLILYFTLLLNKFTLSKITGVILFIVYLICIVLACLSEMVFFKS